MRYVRQIKLCFSLLLLCSPLFVGWAYTCSPAQNVENVYLSWAELRAPIAYDAERELNEPGNLLAYDDMLFVVEGEEGVHFIDQSDPESPELVGFMAIPGASQLALRNNHLYVKSYTDIVVVDMSQPELPVVISRVEDVFYHLSNINHGIIVDRIYTPIEGAGSCGGRSGGGACASSGGASSTPVALPVVDNSVGLAGSMASMIIVQDNLYAISGSDVLTFSIQEADTPVLIGETQTPRNFDTIYYYEEALYFGSNFGVFIYRLDVQGLPSYAGEFEHEWQCDPVVVSGNYAFSTLRSGSLCGRSLDRLDVLDVQDIENPTLITSFMLASPHGLAEENNVLFIADGMLGLKLIQFEEPDSLNLISRITVQDGNSEVVPFAYDVLVSNGLGVYVGRDGVVWFDYSDLSSPRQLHWMESLSSQAPRF